MSEPEKTIKVVDRRLFTADGELREGIAEEMAAEAAVPPASGAAPPPAPEPKIPTDPAFLRLLDMLAQTASLYLEGVPDATGRRHVDLNAAKQIVDSLISLREKSRGRLSFEETDSLEGLIGELQLVFARYAQASAAPKVGGGMPAPPHARRG